MWLTEAKGVPATVCTSPLPEALPSDWSRDEPAISAQALVQGQAWQHICHVSYGVCVQGARNARQLLALAL